MALPVLGSFCSTTLAVGFATSVPNRAQQTYRLLVSWEGKNIARLPAADQSRFMAYLRKDLLPGRIPERFGFDDPHVIFENHGDAFVWRFPSAPDPRFLVYLNPHTGMVPSAEHAWLFIVDQDGKIVSKSEFDTGWRMYSDGATFKSIRGFASPVLIQKMRVGMNGAGPRKIYLAFDHLQPAVIRIEDKSGKLIAMPYFAPNWVVGPTYRPPAKDQMIGNLTGGDDVKRLAALVWLAGHHQSYSENEKDLYHEDNSEEIRFSESIADPKIRRIIKTLRSNPNPYVSELAKTVPSK